MTFDSIYEAVYDTYHPETAWDRMLEAGEPESLNLAEEALGRHGDSEETGLRIRDFGTGETERYTFSELDSAANRAANYLESAMDREERFGVMLEPRVELYASIFGGIKSHRVFIPLDARFGPDAVSYRLADAEATALVTTPEKLDAVEPERIPSLERVLLVGGEGSLDGVEVDTYDAVEDRSDEYDAIRVHPATEFGLKYSSGTTGQPTAMPSLHAAAVGVDPYVSFVVDLLSEDVYFAAASPAWSYGLTVGALCPGLFDTAIGAYRGRFDLERWVETLDEWSVTNAMIAPTALRQLRASDVDFENYDVDLRVLVTAGETLDGETAAWCREHLGTTPQDAYGLTEGGMVLCNYPFPDWEIKPGSMGKPTPGSVVELADPDATTEPADGEDVVEEIARIEGPGTVGEIAIEQTGGSGPMEGYADEGWLLTGDLAERDEDGYWWYRGRADEVIISAGYRIGPEEVQETLLKHDAIEEAGVVGVPHETRGNVVKAFVTPAAGYEPSDELREAVIDFTKAELSKHEYPRELQFIEELPKTTSGKIHRRRLRELYVEE